MVAYQTVKEFMIQEGLKVSINDTNDIFVSFGDSHQIFPYPYFEDLKARDVNIFDLEERALLWCLLDNRYSGVKNYMKAIAEPDRAIAKIVYTQHLLAARQIFVALGPSRSLLFYKTIRYQMQHFADITNK